MPLRDAGVATQFSRAGELGCSVRSGTSHVKPPPHEVGGSSWLEVVLALTVSYGLSSELRRGRTLARR
jgi:hypothetical protein